MAPRKILVIRLQAMGDVVITLPYLEALQAMLPGTQFQLLTREAFASLPACLNLIQRVHRVGGGRSQARQWLSGLALLPILAAEGFDIVIDLQRNALSRMLRRCLHPLGFCEFDRFSPRSAGDRTRNTIDALGFPPLPRDLPPLALREGSVRVDRFFPEPIDPERPLVILNPAGSCATKHWPLEHYVAFSERWLEEVDPRCQFLILGLESLRGRADDLCRRLPRHCRSLVGATSATEAFALLQKADLVLTEDSGLMHMAWVSGIPLVALFGSTNSVWSRPLGPRSVCLDSSDLECGNCAQEVCRFGDVHCLTRHIPEQVLDVARALLQCIKAEA
jgi:ADP-heptose:LPS heptosyltransferase